MDLDWLRSFEGKWATTRRISDGSIFTGTSAFAFDHDRLLLRESGVLRLASGTELPAHRSWRWLAPAPGEIEIRFEDDRTYHRLRLHREAGCLAGSATHLCGADEYSGDYRFGKDEIVSSQRVVGPRKDLVIRTTLVRYGV